MGISLFSGPLPAGALAPDFTLLDQGGRPVSLSSLRGREVVLIFYPGDDTPTCTRQLCKIRDRWEMFLERDVAVLGVNPWKASRHAAFHARHGFPFPLLVDRGQRVAKLYNASGLWVRRTVYLVGKDGTIAFARRGTPSPHEVLAALSRASSPATSS
jgi:peroxiredoxin Q/BCP